MKALDIDKLRNEPPEVNKMTSDYRALVITQ